MIRILTTLLISIFYLTSTHAQEIIPQEIALCPKGDLTSEETHPSCSLSSDGKIVINKSNPDLLTFQLTNYTEGTSIRDFSSDKEFSYLKAGTYRIIAKDSLNRACYSDIELVSPPNLQLIKDSISSVKPNRNRADGSLNINFSGGIQPYKLLINSTDDTYSKYFDLGNRTSTAVYGLENKIYDISVNDGNGCKSVSVQYELSIMDNFDYSIIRSPKTCNKDGIFKIILSNGQGLFNIEVRQFDMQMGLSTTTIFKDTKFDKNEYSVNLNEFGLYELIVQDKRKIPDTIKYNYQKAECDLTVSFTVIDTPTIHESSKGKIEFSISDGSAPFTVLYKNQSNNKILQNNTEQGRKFGIFNIEEGIYNISITDNDGKRFKSSIPISISYPTSSEITSIFKNNKNELNFQLDKYSCNIKTLENKHKAIKITLGILGVGGTIASAGIGTLAGGIASAILGGTPTLMNLLDDKTKLDSLKHNYLILKNIAKKYNEFSDTKFLKANWTNTTYKEYDTMNKKVLEMLDGLSMSIKPDCSPKKLKNIQNKRP